MDLVGNDVDTLHEEIKYLVSHLVENDVDTLYEERIYLVGFNFIRVHDIDISCIDGIPRLLTCDEAVDRR